jgi:diphthamide biosynthesis protein 3
MSATIYDEIEIEDFDFDPEMKTFYYPCPCGDRFQITEVSFLKIFDDQFY